MGSKRKSKGTRAKKVAKTIITAATVAPIALVPTLVAGVAIPPTNSVTVERHLDEVASALIASEIGDSFQVGDSITIDLDEIFGDNSDELLLTLFNTNPSVAEVTLLSGDLYIGGKNAGSTIVEVAARAEAQGPAVRERFTLLVGNNDRIVDVDQDGMTIDDIIRYMRGNPSGLFKRERLGYLLNQIEPIAASVKTAPVSDSEPYEIYLKTNELYTVDVSNFFFDEDGDSLEYSISYSSGAYLNAGLYSGSILTIDTTESTASQKTLWIWATDGYSEASAAKEIIVNVNRMPTFGEASNDLSTSEDTSVVGSVVATDADGDVLSYYLNEDASNGMVEVNSMNGQFTYTPDPNFNGYDSFSIKADDGNGGSAAATVNVSVSAVNDVPIGYSVPNVIAAVGLPREYDVVLEGMFVDPDGDMMTYENIKLLNSEEELDLPEWISFNPDAGLFDMSPTIEDVGIYTISITGMDQSGEGSTVQFNIEVGEFEDLEELVFNDPDQFVINIVTDQGEFESDSLEIDLAEYFTDPLGDGLKFRVNYTSGAIEVVGEQQFTNFTSASIMSVQLTGVASYNDVSVAAQDRLGRVTYGSFSFRSNQAPINELVDVDDYVTFLEVGEEKFIDWLGVGGFGPSWSPFSDPEYDSLSFSAEVISGAEAVEIIPYDGSEGGSGEGSGEWPGEEPGEGSDGGSGEGSGEWPGEGPGEWPGEGYEGGGTFKIRGLQPGEAVLRITASDGYASTSGTFKVKILGEHDFILVPGWESSVILPTDNMNLDSDPLLEYSDMLDYENFEGNLNITPSSEYNFYGHIEAGYIVIPITFTLNDDTQMPITIYILQLSQLD